MWGVNKESSKVRIKEQESAFENGGRMTLTESTM